MFFAEELSTRRTSDRGAEISACGTYRYKLHRVWDYRLQPLLVVMVNPSTADAEEDDPTILRLIAFAKRWGRGSLVVVNLFALRSPDPKALDGHEDPRGPANTATLTWILQEAKKRGVPVLAAWGNNGQRRWADRSFVLAARAEGVPLVCLGLTKDGNPKHPLARGEHRIPDDFDPEPFEPVLQYVTIGCETVAVMRDGRPACGRCRGVGRLALEDSCHRCSGSGEHPQPNGEAP
jgi:hypothetical protein